MEGYFLRKKEKTCKKTACLCSAASMTTPVMDQEVCYCTENTVKKMPVVRLGWSQGGRQFVLYFQTLHLKPGDVGDSPIVLWMERE